MNEWIYKGVKINSIEDIPHSEDYTGFVYCITLLTTGKEYYGKKSFTHSKKSKISIREKLATKSRKTFKRTTKDSGWLSYYGSCKELKDDVKKYGQQYFQREILQLCKTKKYLSFCELEYQIKNDVLKVDSYNGNVLSRYFRKDME